MIEKRRCPNCGAYLTENDAECYVCGEIIGAPNVKPRETAPNQKTYAPVYYEPEADEDFVTPVDHDNAGDTPFEERVPYNDDEIVTGNEKNEGYNDKYKELTDFDPYADYDEEDDGKKKKSKKPLVIIAIIVAVLGIGAIAVAVLFANGFFEKKAAEDYTIYFDKPSVNLILRDGDGKGYNWGADVKVKYTVKSKEESADCSTYNEYENMWKCKVPVNAKDICFYQSSGGELRTDVIGEVEDQHVYYVTDIMLSADGALPVAHCHIDEFDNFGVNAVQPTTTAEEETKATKATKATEKTTDTTAESSTATEETTTAPEGKGYEVTLPEKWAKNTKAVEKDNCVTYYEKYNYKYYDSGMLLSIYVFDKGDNSYGDLNVKKVLTASDGRKVVIVTPTDVQFDDSDEKAAKRYIALEDMTDEIISSITVK